MATCPSGHESASDDYCDVCGALIGAAVLTPFAQAPGSMPAQAPVASARRRRLPALRRPAGRPVLRVVRLRLQCRPRGHLRHRRCPPVPQTRRPRKPHRPRRPHRPRPTAPPPLTAPPGLVPSATPANGAAWTVLVTADRAYYDSVQDAGGPDAAAIGFPAYCPERRFRLAGAEVRVGRRSETRGIHPEIDLTGPPADPGVSRLHVVLVAAPDGTWSVVDPGSANGTLVNGDEIPAGETVPLRDGDVIHLGAWTALTVTSG